ncbi:ABC transporter substrate-binding protein [Streptomyces chartreusis]|uniref:ABC transporter substrate-binding protein n=1 Tax=Streptomyces chartreusis TaxID=1969 RepID=UPI00371F4E23
MFPFTRAAVRGSRRNLRTIPAVVTAALAVTLGACSNPPVSGSASPATGSPVPTAEVDPALQALVPEKYRTAGRIHVATNAPYAPYEMFTSAGSKDLTGLEIDLGKAVGQKLGVPFVFSQQPYDGLFPGLQAGKYDLLMAALFDTRERERTVDFVNYSRSGSALLVLKGKADGIGTLHDLCGVQVAAQKGSAQVVLLQHQSAACAKAGKPAVQVKTFPQFSDAQLALKTGTVKVVAGDLPALGYAVRQDPASPYEVVKDPKAPNGYQSSLTGIGVPKGQPKLREAIRLALQALIDDGTYDRILARYGASGIAIGKAVVNRAQG